MAGHTEPEYFEAARLKGQIVVRGVSAAFLLSFVLIRLHQNRQSWILMRTLPITEVASP